MPRYRSAAAPGTIVGYGDDGFPVHAAFVTGEILGYSKDHMAIHAAANNQGHYGNEPYAKPSYTASAATGAIMGYSKDGFPIRAADVMGGYHFSNASITDQLVCGGSNLVFIAVGLGLGWLVADKFAEYIKNKR